MAKTDQLSVQFAADTKKASSDIKKFSKEQSREIGKFAQSIDSGNVSAGTFAKGLGGLVTPAAAAGLALAAVVKVSADAIKIWHEDEKAQAKLSAVIKATGEAAGFTAGEMLDMATSLERSTTESTSSILNLQSILATFKSIRGDVFERTTEAAIDLSTVFGGSLESSATMLGKALEDPVRGLTALRRVGVTFSSEQEKVIKSLVETGDIASAQGEILKALEGQVGGAGKAMAETGAGEIQQLNNALRSLKSGFGESLSEGLRPFVRGLRDLVNEMVDANAQMKLMRRAAGASEKDLLGSMDVAELQVALKGYREELEKLEKSKQELEKGGGKRYQLDTGIGLYSAKELNNTKEMITLLETTISKKEEERSIRKKILEDEEKRMLRQRETEEKEAAHIKWLESQFAKTDAGKLAGLEKELEYLEQTKWTADQLAMVDSIRQKLLDDIASARKEEIIPLSESLTLIQKEFKAEEERREKINEVGEALSEIKELKRQALEEGNYEALEFYTMVNESLEEQYNRLVKINEEEKKQNEYIDALAETLASSALRSMEAIGVALSDGASGAEAMGAAARQMAADMLRQTAQLMLNAGLRLIASGNIPAGLALVAGSGLVALGAGLFGGSGGSAIPQGPAKKILSAEEKLANERVKIIEEQLKEERRLRQEQIRKLDSDFTREYEILREKLRRNLITHEEFQSQAKEMGSVYLEEKGRVESESAEKEAALTAQKELENARRQKLDQLKMYLDQLWTERNGMSWVQKNVTQKSKYKSLKNAISNTEKRINAVNSAQTIDAVWAAKYGASFTTRGPMLLKVGDNPGGVEQVNVKPISTPNRFGPQSSGGDVNVHIHGPIYGIDHFNQLLDESRKRLLRRGRMVS